MTPFRAPARNGRFGARERCPESTSPPCPLSGRLMELQYQSIWHPPFYFFFSILSVYVTFSSAFLGGPLGASTPVEILGIAGH